MIQKIIRFFNKTYDSSIFATTALVATAGVAQADVTLSGAANFGVVNDGSAGAETQAYNNASVTATMSGTTDNGLTFGTNLTVRVGDDVDLDAGDLGDNATIAALSATDFGNIFVSGAFGTLTFDRDGIDNVHNDDFGNHDVSYNYSTGGWTVDLTADIDNDGAAYADGEEWAVAVSYTMDPLTVRVATDDSGEADATLTYVLNEMLTVSLNHDTDGQTVNGAADAENTLKVSYDAGNGFTGSLSLIDDDDDAWEASLGYTMGALTLGATLGEDGADDDVEVDVSASYDLGGGMKINAAANETGAFFLGAAMSF